MKGYHIGYFAGLSSAELAKAFHEEGEDGVESFEKLFSKLHLMKRMYNIYTKTTGFL